MPHETPALPVFHQLFKRLEQLEDSLGILAQQFANIQRGLNTGSLEDDSYSSTPSNISSLSSGFDAPLSPREGGSPRRGYGGGSASAHTAPAAPMPRPKGEVEARPSKSEASYPHDPRPSPRTYCPALPCRVLSLKVLCHCTTLAP